jgi:hypothetical protein
MLKPNTETDLSLSIMYLGSEIISILPQNKYIYIEDILKKFLEADKRRSPDNFLDTLTFLYSLGLIDNTGYKIKLHKHAYTQTSLF